MRCFLGTAACIALVVGVSVSSVSRADTIYQQTNLVSDIQGLAAITDPNLVNPWGVSFSATSPFWVSDTGKNIATLYAVNSAGVVSKSATEVTIPTTASGPQGPTGQVFNSTAADFVIPANNAKANFIFANFNGTISAWNGTLSPNTQSVVVATTPGASYTGLAVGSNASGNLLYAANNTAGKIDVFNGSFATTSLGGNAFANPAGTAGLVPFNVQNINGTIYVTYSLPGHTFQASAQEGQGAVAAFDTSGNFKAGSLITGGKLASPWGIALAPASFGTFGGDLLIGNFAFGFSEINAFDAVTGVYRGTLTGSGGTILNDGLWALNFGNGGSNGNPDTLYFAAGIMRETHGLFGAIAPAAAAPVPEPGTLALLVAGGLAACGLALTWGRKPWLNPSLRG